MPKASAMKIKAINTIPLRIPFNDPAPADALAGQRLDAHHLVLVKVETEGGIVGYGEALAYLPVLQRPLVALLNDAIAPLAIGRDARDINGLVHNIQFQLASFGRGGLIANALSALDIALWDIAGRASGQPLHRLLGGNLKAEIPCIASLNRYLDPVAVAERSRAAVERGYTRVKVHERDIEVVRAARKAVGPDVRLMVDVNCHWSIEQAHRVLPELLECDPYWLEDPIWPPENFDGLRELKDRFGIRLATGGDASMAWRFKEILAADCIAFAQPDTCVVGGVTEFCKVAALCALKNVTVAPHTPFQGPAMLASLHVISTLRDDSAYAYTFVEFEASMYGAAGVPSHGMLTVPQEPGLGYDPDPDFLRDYHIKLA